MGVMDKPMLSEGELCQCLRGVWPEQEGQATVGAFATLTDEEWGGTLDELLEYLGDEDRLAHLLELRVFEVAQEMHVARDYMGAPFAWRLVGGNDEALGKQGLTLDDIQFLDINRKVYERLCEQDSTGRTYRSMSGGTYRLPIAGANRIHLRNYLEYDEDGVAGIVDFRIVSLLREGE